MKKLAELSDFSWSGAEVKEEGKKRRRRVDLTKVQIFVDMRWRQREARELRIYANEWL